MFAQAGVADEEGAAEAAWVGKMCAGDPAFGGMVVWAPVDEGADAVARQLDRLGLPAVRGVRRLIQGDPIGLASQPGFIAGVAELGRRRALDQQRRGGGLQKQRMVAGNSPG